MVPARPDERRRQRGGDVGAGQLAGGELRAGFIRHDFYIRRFGDGYDPASTGLPPGLVSQLPRPFFPQVQMTGYSTFGNQGSLFTISDTWSWSEIFNDPRNIQLGVRLTF